MAELEHLDETHQEVVDRTGTKQWNTMFLGATKPQNSFFFYGGHSLWFPRAKMNTLEFFLNGGLAHINTVLSPQQYCTTHQDQQVQTKSHFGEH
jgi:hypothetical protein